MRFQIYPYLLNNSFKYFNADDNPQTLDLTLCLKCMNSLWQIQKKILLFNISGCYFLFLYFCGLSINVNFIYSVLYAWSYHQIPAANFITFMEIQDHVSSLYKTFRFKYCGYVGR